VFWAQKLLGSQWTTKFAHKTNGKLRRGREREKEREREEEREKERERERMREKERRETEFPSNGGRKEKPNLQWEGGKIEHSMSHSIHEQDYLPLVFRTHFVLT
jgi:hypothetical protein